MKIYSMIAAAALFVVFSLGFALPFLFSATSDILVGLGVLYILAMPVILVKMYKATKKMINKETEIENS